MKPTSRNSMERRLEALEGHQADKERMPELRLVLNKDDGSQEIHVLGVGGCFIVPAKLTPQAWNEKAARMRAT